MAAAMTDLDRQLLALLQDGLPLVSAPYAALAQRLGISEAEVCECLRRLQEEGVISRFGLVVRHHELGYRANAMVVWDVPDTEVREAGRRLAALDFVTLCYRRPRRPPRWPYNLFCMVHGLNRDEVLAQVAQAARQAGLDHVQHEVLFSTRRFKQRGARYGSAAEAGDRVRVA
jgi:DNA-binding Lrp family transcriptional regulator